MGFDADVVGRDAVVVGGSAVIFGSAQVEEALRHPHDAAVRAEVWHHGYKRGPIPIAGGSYRVGGDDLVRRDGSIEVPNSREVRDLLVPGVAVRLWRGVEGVGRPIPVMWGLVGKPSRDGSSLTLPLTDLSRRVARHGFLKPRRSIRGATIAGQIEALWREAIPFLRGFVNESFDVTAMPDVTWTESDSRAAQIIELGNSIGCESFLRPDGFVVLRRMASIYSRPVWTPSDDLIVEADAEADIEEVVNSVAVQSEHPSGATAVGSYTDTESDTGTAALGTITDVVRSAIPTSKAQCDVMARTIVLRASGARILVDYESVLHPGVEVGDVHGIRTTTRGQRRRYSMVLDSVSVPDIFGASMEGAGRVAKLGDDVAVEVSS